VLVTHVIEIDHVSFVAGGAPILEDVTFTVARGDFLGIIGPNGSGKTTLLRVMLGLLTPTAGAVRLFGTPIAAFREWRRLGYVPQRAVLDPGLPFRVDEVVASGLVLGRGPRGQVRTRVAHALSLVGMERHDRVRAGTLSAGQQQRVLIARALVSDPELLVLDEPTGGVDPEAETSFYTLLQGLHRDHGVSLVLVSHDVGVVAQAVTKLACLNRRLIFCGRPDHALTADVMSAMYGPHAHVVAHLPSCPHAG
jgi:zinc transport system ATP-binding protein